MSNPRKLFLNLYWHMHQPDYRDYVSGEYVLPWTYLHAIKDYTDMAYHLEQNPRAKASFNFVPVLLDQLEDLAGQFASGEIRDPLLALLALGDQQPLDEQQRRLILDSCFKSNHAKMIAPFPHYAHLHAMFRLLEAQGEEAYVYLSDQYMRDLLVWYHLVWTGESVRREHALVVDMMAKGGDFGEGERRALFGLIGELIADVIPRYRALAKRGQIEISSTPHYHPILPLLIDFKSARDNMPSVTLPENERYPGGITRAREHVVSALQSHYRRFGQRPQGMWPAEGGVSQAALMLLAKEGVAWAATGEGVLGSSLAHAYGEVHMPERQHYLYKPYRVSDGERSITCFFRDDLLSDKIGFEYANWHGRDAVNDFVGELERIWKETDPAETPVVSVILDGENAWEYYPYNGYYFLSELYETLADHPYIELSTFSEVLRHCDGAEQPAEPPIEVEELHSVRAGSWVYGNFSTWIGSAEKNRGWDLLCEAKKSYDLVMAGHRLDDAEKTQAERQLADCEGSDWFWWFGDYNPSLSVSSFDQLYRRNLSNLYRVLKLQVPRTLEHAISVGGGSDTEAGGTMRRGHG